LQTFWTLFRTTCTPQQLSTLGTAEKLNVVCNTLGPPLGAYILMPGPGSSTAGKKLTMHNDPPTNTDHCPATALAKADRTGPGGGEGS